MTKQQSRIGLVFLGLFTALVAFLTAGSMIAPVAAQDSMDALYLPMVATDHKKNEPQPGSPSSEFLIESARQAGELDDETALLYRVYASFEDARLPEKYRGDDSNAALSLALRQAQAQFVTLSPETQATLAPFLQPPMAPDSWVEQRVAGEEQALAAQNQPEANINNRIVWLTTCQTDPNIKVWYQQRYPEDADDARALCELVRGTIWPRLTNLFGHTPPEDGGQSNNGGDGQFDIYLVNAKTVTQGYDGCFNTPSYILVNNQKWSEYEIVEAMMSAFMNGYNAADCVEYMWLYAASRTWAIDYVLPQDNHEQTYADDFLNHTRYSLNTYPVVPLESENQIGDGAYLWLWYVTNFVSSAKEFIPVIWKNSTNPDSLAVVNSAVPGGFAAHWADFSEQNWNNEPVKTYFTTDLLLHSTKPELDTEVKLDGEEDRTFALDGNVDYLAAHTYHFTFTDPGVRSLLFINPFHDNAWPTARIDAIYKMADGSWKLEEWTKKYSKEFCRDLEAERIVDLTLIISNHEWKDRNHELKPAYPPRLNATNVACRGWNFTGKATQTMVGAKINSTETTTVDATYMREKSGDDSNAHPFGIFRVTEGSGSWTHNGTSYNCKANGSGTFELSGSFQTILFLFNNATDHQSGTLYAPGDRRYSGFGTEGMPNLDKLKVTYVCPNGNSGKSMVMSAARWFMTETEPTQEVSADGATITGSFTIVDQDDAIVKTTSTFEWTMKALPPE